MHQGLQCGDIYHYMIALLAVSLLLYNFDCPQMHLQHSGCHVLCDRSHHCLRGQGHHGRHVRHAYNRDNYTE